MKRFSSVTTFILTLMIPFACYAGSITKTFDGEVGKYKKYRKIVWAYDSGSVADAITGDSTNDATNCVGKIVQFVSVPNTSTAPDDLFDVEIRDQSNNGYDILVGTGDDLPNDCSTGDHEDECRITPVDSNGGVIHLNGETLRFWIDNMDDSTDDADGEIILLIELGESKSRR